MSAITISREIGSQGDEIAAQVALALGHHLVDRRFIGSILSQYGLVEFDQEYQTLPGFWQRFDAQREQRRDQMVAMLNQVIQAVARHGNVVIVGRSGYVVLAGFADVLHVRLQAPQEVRIARVAVSQGLSAAQAEDAVQTSDLVRATFVEDFYDVSWEAIHAFDLIINTGQITPQRAVAWICDAARDLKRAPELGRPTLGTLSVDPVLSAAVAQALHCERVHA